MKGFARWIWERGIVGTFLTGLFAILPIAMTAAIIGWVGGKLWVTVEPGTVLGSALRRMGLEPLVDNPTVALIIGGAFVVVAIWALGLLIKSTARHRLDDAFHALVNRIPIVNTIYKPVSQVVGLLKGDDKSDMKGMAVVYCVFGTEGGCGFLGLQASAATYRIGEKDCRLVYVPTSPVPMSGGLLFVPSDAVTTVDMTVDDVMKIYFSLGVLSSQVIPEQYQPAAAG